MKTVNTSKVAKEYVTSLLNDYIGLQQKIHLLEYELKCSTLSGEDLIEAMALRVPVLNGVAVKGGSVSDSTARIATEYEQVLICMDNEVRASMESELHTLQATVGRIDFYVDLLPPEQAEVIRGYYMEGKSWPELEKKLHKAVRTLSDHRDKGVEALARMFQYIGSKVADAKKTRTSAKGASQM